MSLIHPLIDVKEFVENNSCKSRFITPISGDQGSSTTAFCSVSTPHDLPHRHLHTSCDEISILIRGEGVYGLGDQRISARVGDCRVVPKGAEHFFINESGEPSLMIGFFVGAEDVAATGIAYGDLVTKDDLATLRGEQDGGILINLGDVQPENMDQGDGWRFPPAMAVLQPCSGRGLCRVRFTRSIVMKTVTKFIILSAVAAWPVPDPTASKCAVATFISFLKALNIGSTISAIPSRLNWSDSIVGPVVSLIPVMSIWVMSRRMTSKQEQGNK